MRPVLSLAALWDCLGERRKSLFHLAAHDAVDRLAGLCRCSMRGQPQHDVAVQTGLDDVRGLEFTAGDFTADGAHAHDGVDPSRRDESLLQVEAVTFKPDIESNATPAGPVLQDVVKGIGAAWYNQRNVVQAVERESRSRRQGIARRANKDVRHSRDAVSPAAAASGIFGKERDVQFSALETVRHPATHAADQVQPDLGEQARQFGVDGLAEGICQGVDDPQAHKPGGLSEHAGRMRCQEVSSLDPGLDLRIESQADFVQANTSRCPLKQLAAACLFDRRQLSANGRLGHISRRSSVRQAATLGDLKKQLPLADREVQGHVSRQFWISSAVVHLRLRRAGVPGHCVTAIPLCQILSPPLTPTGSDPLCDGAVVRIAVPIRSLGFPSWLVLPGIAIGVP